MKQKGTLSLDDGIKKQQKYPKNQKTYIHMVKQTIQKIRTEKNVSKKVHQCREKTMARLLHNVRDLKAVV